MQALEIAADRDRFGDAGAVVELQHGQPAGGVLRQKFRRAVLARHQVDFFHGKGSPLFGQEDAHPARVWRLRMVVELHRLGSFLFELAAVSFSTLFPFIRSPP